jgi:hypothetical protein
LPVFNDLSLFAVKGDIPNNQDCLYDITFTERAPMLHYKHGFCVSTTISIPAKKK